MGTKEKIGVEIHLEGDSLNVRVHHGADPMGSRSWATSWDVPSPICLPYFPRAQDMPAPTATTASRKCGGPPTEARIYCTTFMELA